MKSLRVAGGLLWFVAALMLSGLSATVSAQTLAVRATPSPAVFGDLALGQSSETTVQVEVVGFVPGEITEDYSLDASFGAVGPFALSNVNCPVFPDTLPVTQSCSLSLRFAPTATGPDSFSQELTYLITVEGDPVGSGAVLVSANGNGVEPDSDGDGVPDSIDQCTGTPAGTAVDEVGCPLVIDSDGDGVEDGIDQCPDTPPGTPVDDSGCPLDEGDGDGVPDAEDRCPDTPPGAIVDAEGCAESQKDDDGDGVSNDIDRCPDTPPGTDVDSAGCPLPPDSDDDGILDSSDRCPNTPPGASVDGEGCADSQKDSDGDGVSDADDQCPNTPPGTAVDDSGCPLEEPPLDSDGDGVPDGDDQCPNTPPGSGVDADGCADSQTDSDGDGVSDADDQCPNTPPGTAVDDSGCPLEEPPVDSDGDGVSDADDQCPNTPSGTAVDDSGCPLEEPPVDSDGDGVVDGDDRCPNTPAGAAVDAAGCADSQNDSDGDGVSDADDQCPNTPPGTEVDGDGCPLPQDDDGDGVDNGIDECPATPPGAAVDASGCAESQRDSDGDGVDDSADRCPATPAGEAVDADGCGASQLDSDGDGVNDAEDECPDTAGSGDDGCPTQQEAEEAVRETLGSYTGGDPVLDETTDVIADSCTSGRASAELQAACDNLTQAAEEGASGVDEALREITPEKATKGNVSVRQSNRVQNRNIGDRMVALRAGARGASFRGLTANFGGYRTSVEDMAEAIAQAVGPLGGGASGDDPDNALLADSRWGFFVSGELTRGDKDQTALTSGFDYDNTVITTGLDYRLTSNLVLGGAVSFINSENDIDFDGGSLDAEGESFTLYGTWYRERLFLDFSVSTGAMDYEQTRRIRYDLGTGVSVDNLFDADYDGDSVGAFAGLGWNLVQSSWNVNLRATLDYLESDLGAFAESARAPGASGAGWAIALDDQSQTWLTGTATASASYVFTPNWGVLIPFLEIDLIHEFENDSRRVTGRFVGDLDGESLTVLTDDPDTDYFRIRAGASVQLPGGFAAFADYGRLYSFDNWSEYTISAGLRYEF